MYGLKLIRNSKNIIFTIPACAFSKVHPKNIKFELRHCIDTIESPDSVIHLQPQNQISLFMCLKKRDFYIFLILLFFVGYAVIQRLSSQPTNASAQPEGNLNAGCEAAPVSQSTGNSNISATFSK